MNGSASIEENIFDASFDAKSATQMDDDDVLDIYRSWLYQEIPLDQFRIWGREPFGQGKIDAAARQPPSKADKEQALQAAVEKWIEEHGDEIYVR